MGQVPLMQQLGMDQAQWAMAGLVGVLVVAKRDGDPLLGTQQQEEGGPAGKGTAGTGSSSSSGSHRLGRGMAAAGQGDEKVVGVLGQVRTPRSSGMATVGRAMGLVVTAGVTTARAVAAAARQRQRQQGHVVAAGVLLLLVCTVTCG